MSYYINTLAVELRFKIFNYLDNESLGNVACVSKGWYRLVVASIQYKECLLTRKFVEHFTAISNHAKLTEIATRSCTRYWVRMSRAGTLRTVTSISPLRQRLETIYRSVLGTNEPPILACVLQLAECGDGYASRDMFRLLPLFVQRQHVEELVTKGKLKEAQQIVYDMPSFPHEHVLKAIQAILQGLSSRGTCIDKVQTFIHRVCPPYKHKQMLAWYISCVTSTTG